MKRFGSSAMQGYITRCRRLARPVPFLRTRNTRCFSQGNAKTDAVEIFKSCLKAADPNAAVKNAMKVKNGKLNIRGKDYDLNQYSEVVVVGAGKASVSMAQATEDVLSESKKTFSGHIVTKYHHSKDHSLRTITVTEGGHPVLDKNCVLGTEEIVKTLKRCSKDTLVIVLISGGGSALLESPVEGIGLAEYQAATNTLLATGATINEMNAIRKHLSKVKGGQLALLAGESQVVSLILSDVIGDPLDTIASGPTVPDSTTFQDCAEIVKKLHIKDSLPSSVMSHLEEGLKSSALETPKADGAFFEKNQVEVIGSLKMAVDMAEQKAQELGYHTIVLSTHIEGEASEIAKFYVGMGKEILHSNRPIPRPACVIAGGETTVTLKGKGMGGRNQEMALSAARELSGVGGIVFLSGATDGTDGPTDSAGGVVDGNTVARGTELGVCVHDYLDRNDAYNYLKKVDSHVMTGPTGTNVMDVQLVIVR